MRCRVLKTTVCFVGLGFAFTATAQESVLEEVIVSAQKRDERIQDVPLSISVIGASTLESQQNVRLQDYFSQVPGLAVSATSGGRLTVAIRGITTGGSTNPTVGITVDDVPIGSSVGSTYSNYLAIDIDPATLERVEVLRGPQGTLYGASSLGGLLRYVTVAPRMNEFFGRVQADGASLSGGDNAYGARGSANIPLVDDKLAATVSAFFRRDAGFVDDPGRGMRDVDTVDARGSRLSALWQASEAVSLRVSALVQKIEGDGSSDVFADASLRPIAGLSQSYNIGTGPYERTVQQYDATLKADFGWASLTSISGYSRSEFLEVSDETVRFGGLTELATGRTDLGTARVLPSETKKFSQEVRLASPSGQTFEWLFGAFYTDEDSDVQWNLYGADLQTGAFVADVFPDSFPSTLEEKAVFATATYHFTDRFDVQVGGRYGSNEQTYNELITGPLYDPEPYVANAASEDSSFTYLVSPRMRFTENVMTYGRLATGYRPGGPNPGAGFGLPSEFDADTTLSYELGLKGEFLDRRLALDVSVYNIDWDDIQLQEIDPVTEFVYYSNAGKARSRGLEAALHVAPMDRLRFDANIGYNDAELSQPTSGGIVAAAGDPLPFSAEWSASVSGEKEFVMNGNTTMFVGSTLTYLGERFGNFAPFEGAPRVRMPSYTTMDLRAGVRHAGWTFSAFGNNLGDKRGILSAYSQVSGGENGVYVLNYIRPRMIGLSVGKEF